MSLEVRLGLMLCSPTLLKRYKYRSMTRFSVKDYSSYTKQIKSQTKGQNLENIVSQCHRELDWDSRDVISGGLGGSEAPKNFDDAKFFYINYAALRRSENASTSITTL